MGCSLTNVEPVLNTCIQTLTTSRRMDVSSITSQEDLGRMIPKKRKPQPVVSHIIIIIIAMGVVHRSPHLTLRNRVAGLPVQHDTWGHSEDGV